MRAIEHMFSCHYIAMYVEFLEHSEGSLMQFIVRNEIAVFFVVTLALSATISAVSFVKDNEGLSLLTVLSPTIAALFLTAVTSGWQGVKDLTVGHILKRFAWRWLLLSLLFFPVATMVLQAAFLGTPFQLQHTDLMPYVIVIFIISIGEEFGWRAYAMPPLLDRFSVLASGAIVGVVWAIWHFPGALIGAGVPENIPFMLFALWVVGAGILMGWVYAKTRSVIPAIVIHSSANASFIYSPLLPDGTASIWPFGALVGIVWAAVCILIWVAKIGFGPESNRVE